VHTASTLASRTSRCCAIVSQPRGSQSSRVKSSPTMQAVLVVGTKSVGTLPRHLHTIPRSCLQRCSISRSKLAMLRACSAPHFARRTHWPLICNCLTANRSHPVLRRLAHPPAPIRRLAFQQDTGTCCHQVLDGCCIPTGPGYRPTARAPDCQGPHWCLPMRSALGCRALGGHTYRVPSCSRACHPPRHFPAGPR
jgi:hypothetical protein